MDDIEQAARKQSVEDNLLARYRTEWPWWDDLHALWCEHPNFNPPGVQNSATQSTSGLDIPIDPQLLTPSPPPTTPSSPPPSTTLSSPPPPSTVPSSSKSTRSSSQRPQGAKRVKVNPIEKLKTSVKELAEMEMVRAKEEFAYKRYKLDIQDKALDRALEEKKLRFQAQMQLYEFRFRQWVDKKLPEEPSLPRFN